MLFSQPNFYSWMTPYHMISPHFVPFIWQAIPSPSYGLSFTLTFRARASYRLGRHLNTSVLPQARASHTLGQPQPQPFKYFALNIFREISLILSPRSFPASCSDWSTMYPFFIWGCLYTSSDCIAFFFCSIRLAGEWLTWSSGVRDHTLFGLQRYGDRLQ